MLSQGQSDLATERKQRGLYYAFTFNYVVIKKHASWAKPYLHFDLNAGNGYNDDAGCVGSPLTFMQVFHEIPHFRATFVDREKAQLDALQAREIMQDPRCSLHLGDNAEFLSALQINGSWQFGTILSDPNGADVPIDALIYASKRYPRIDQIFHWNSTITKRLKYGIKPDQITLADIPKLIFKKDWLIREPVGPHQFAMLIGRNFRGNDWPAGGFYHLNSSRGEEILDRCSRSRKERTTGNNNPDWAAFGDQQPDLLGETA
jgi:hypothetical protein